MAEDEADERGSDADNGTDGSDGDSPDGQGGQPDAGDQPGGQGGGQPETGDQSGPSQGGEGGPQQGDQEGHRHADSQRDEHKFCVECGAQIREKAEICPECGVRQPQATGSSDKDRTAAALLAILLGGIGAHKFYLGDTGLGILYLCFSWTLIPAIVGLIEGIIYLTKSEEEFQRQYVD